MSYLQKYLCVMSVCIALVLQSCSTNELNEVKIGDQTWASENLSVTTFSNGDAILEAQSKEEWAAANANKTPAWCYYDGDPVNGDKYGKLYNWYAVTDLRSIAPEGWKVSSKYDFEVLFEYLGGVEIAGAKMKSDHGWKEGENGTNESGFSSLPSGYRNMKGDFRFITEFAGWSLIDEFNDNNQWGIVNEGKVSSVVFITAAKSDGAAIRLVRKNIKN